MSISAYLALSFGTLSDLFRVTSEAKHRFDLYVTGKDKSAVNQNLRGAIFGTAVQQGGRSEYEALKNEYTTTTSIDGKEITLRALGRFQDPALLPDFLDFIFTKVTTQDVHTAGSALGHNPKARHGLWKHIHENFSSIREKLGKNMTVLNRFLNLSLTSFNDKETADEIARFFEGKDNRGYDRTLNIVNDTILGRAKYKERDAAVILEWLKAHGYA